MEYGMELNESERNTILRSFSLYKDTVKFCLRNRKAKRSNSKIKEMINLYEQDLLNIENITKYLK